MRWLEGKKALVIGVANEHSIAWGVAEAFHGAGAELAITYLNSKAEPHVRPLAERVGAPIILPLDVARAEQAEALFEAIAIRWGRLDILVHSIAFAPRDDLQGRVVDASAEGFALAMDISVHSLLRLVRRAEPLMIGGGAVLTMSFYGAQKVIGTYNIMGPVKAALEAATRELASELGERNISVNAISPGPMPTRAAGGLSDFDRLMEESAARAPLRRLVTLAEVGAAAVYLASDAGRAVTGATLHVDGGANIMG